MPKTKREVQIVDRKTHRCTEDCWHTCGEAGGVTRSTGKPCGQPGGWGVPNVPAGSLRLCQGHDPEHNPVFAFDGLTGKQMRFVVEYCGRANGVGIQAARLAGYADNPNNLKVVAHMNLRNPRIKKAIKERFEELAMSSEELIKRLSDTARASVESLVHFDEDENGHIRLTPENIKYFGPLIKEIHEDPETGALRVKLESRASAQRELAKIRRLYSDGTQVNFHLHMNELSNEDLLSRIEKMREDLVGPRLGRYPERPQLALAPVTGDGDETS